MSNFTYEFLSYEAFPEDQYIKEIVEVCICGAVVLPYVHMAMKDGGSFWGFTGCGATKNGTKKRFNGVLDSRTLKIKFENDLNAFIATKTQRQVQTQTSVFNTNQQAPIANYGHYSQPTQSGVAADGGELPF